MAVGACISVAASASHPVHQTAQVIGELLQPGQRLLVAKGGKGGAGVRAPSKEQRQNDINRELKYARVRLGCLFMAFWCWIYVSSARCWLLAASLFSFHPSFLPGQAPLTPTPSQPTNQPTNQPKPNTQPQSTGVWRRGGVGGGHQLAARLERAAGAAALIAAAAEGGGGRWDRGLS